MLLTEAKIQEIQEGLELAFKKMLKEKKQKGSLVVVMRDNKVVELTPEELELELEEKYKTEKKTE